MCCDVVQPVRSFLQARFAKPLAHRQYLDADMVCEWNGLLEVFEDQFSHMRLCSVCIQWIH
jgi:hypothetical protein